MMHGRTTLVFFVPCLVAPPFARLGARMYNYESLKLISRDSVLWRARTNDLFTINSSLTKKFFLYSKATPHLLSMSFTSPELFAPVFTHLLNLIRSNQTESIDSKVRSMFATKRDFKRSALLGRKASNTTGTHNVQTANL
jgi:hypothetical protein